MIIKIIDGRLIRLKLMIKGLLWILTAVISNTRKKTLMIDSQVGKFNLKISKT